MAQGIAAIPSGESVVRRVREAREAACGNGYGPHRSAQGEHDIVLGQDKLGANVLEMSLEKNREGRWQVGNEMRKAVLILLLAWKPLNVD